VSDPVFVWGSSGLLAGELLRLIESHPGLHLAGAVSRTAGRSLRALHPHLATDATTLDAQTAEAQIAQSIDDGATPGLVLGLPHGEAAQVWKGLRRALGAKADRVRVVDLSADYRLQDVAAYEHWYGRAHADVSELPHFAYGLPEWNREALQTARRVAAPGCFATALQLAALPAARAGVCRTDAPWVLNAVTGSSGSGSSPKAGTHHPHRHGNLWAYGMGGHRHEAELSQALAAFGVEAPLAFQPHSGPFVRGIHLTASLPLAQPIERGEAHALYAETYAGEPFVEVLAEGAPDLRRVVGSNRASLGVHVRESVLTVFATIDNVIKGGSGQGLQCLNLMLGRPETEGLPRAGLGVS
jgi:N-acetyl-gamma-glutamyl-phosphate reductase